MSEDKPFFTNAQGEQQKSVYHSYLTRHRDLMIKFKQTPFDSRFPRDDTPGKVVYMELPDGRDYIYQIENEAIVQILDQIEPNEWYRVTASGAKEEATLDLAVADSYEQEEREAIVSEAPAEVSTSTVASEPTPVKNNTPTHVDCTAMTLETVNAFEGSGTVLESDAIARIYNTHFIALSKQKGGLIR